jgi:hypothetical protein
MKQKSQLKATSQGECGNGFAVSRNLTPHLVLTESCKPLGCETRKHPPAQLRKLAASLKTFGFVLPILLDPKARVIAGWGLVLAARQLGLPEVPAVCVAELSEAELRALRLALNRIADEAVWDREVLATEFSEILELTPEIDLEITGFETGEIDGLDGDGSDQEDELPPPIDATAIPVTRFGDVWLLGKHGLLCGDAREAESYAHLLGGRQGGHGVRRSAVQCRDRRPRVGAGRGQAP